MAKVIIRNSAISNRYNVGCYLKRLHFVCVFHFMTLIQFSQKL